MCPMVILENILVTLTRWDSFLDALKALLVTGGNNTVCGHIFNKLLGACLCPHFDWHITHSIDKCWNRNRCDCWYKRITKDNFGVYKKTNVFPSAVFKISIAIHFTPVKKKIPMVLKIRYRKHALKMVEFAWLPTECYL